MLQPHDRARLERGWYHTMADTCLPKRSRPERERTHWWSDRARPERERTHTIADTCLPGRARPERERTDTLADICLQDTPVTQYMDDAEHWDGVDIEVEPGNRSPSMTSDDWDLHPDRIVVLKLHTSTYNLRFSPAAVRVHDRH